MQFENLQLLSPRDICDLTGFDSHLLRPDSQGSEDGWLINTLEMIACRRTWETLVAQALRDGHVTHALMCAARAESAGVIFPESVELELAANFKRLRERHTIALSAAVSQLSQINPQAPTAMNMATEIQVELAELTLPSERPRGIVDLERALEVQRRLDALNNDIQTLINEAEQEAEQQREMIAKLGIDSMRRVLALLSRANPGPASREAHILRAIPELILGGKAEILQRVADPAIPLDDVVLQAEAGAYVPGVVRAPPLGLASLRRPASSPFGAPALVALSTTSEALLRLARESPKGIGSEEDLQKFREHASKLPHIEDAARLWFGVYKATSDKRFSMVALGEGLLTAGKGRVEQESYRLAIELLSDAMVCLIEARHALSEDTVEEAVFSLIAAKAWPRYIAMRPAQHTRTALAAWMGTPQRVLEWIRENGQLDLIANTWADLNPGHVAEVFIERVMARLDRGEILRACAIAAMTSHRLRSVPNRSIDQIKRLLSFAGASERLLQALDIVGNELRDVIDGKSKAATQNLLKAQIAILRGELDGTPRDSTPYIDEIAEQLPVILERLIGASASPVTEAEPSIQPLVKAFNLLERAHDLRLPLLVRNRGSAPLDNLALVVSAGDATEPRVNFDNQPQMEQFIGTLDPDPEGGQEVIFNVNVPKELLDQVNEILLKASLRTGLKVLREKEFTIGIRTRDRRHQDSPFTTGGAVTGRHFIGRAKELRRLIGLLTADTVQTPLVVGIRRIGKTSLIKKMMEDPEINRRYHPIYWSVEDRPDSDSTVQFFIDLCKRIVDQLPKELRGRAAFSRDELRREPYSAFEVFADSLQELGSGKRILLVIDEFDTLLKLVKNAAERPKGGAPLQPHEAFQPQVLGALRKVIMKGGALRMVFAGLPAILNAQYEDRLFGTLDAIELQGFSVDEAEEVIDEAKEVFTVSPQAREQILSATGCQPYLLQLLCHNLFSYMIFSGRDQAAPRDIEDVIEEKLLPHESYFTDYVSLIGEYSYLLRAVALAHREVAPRRSFVSVNEVTRVLQKQGYDASVQVVREALQGLFASDRPLVIRAPNDSNRFRLVIGILGEYLIRRRNS